jgi:hypothetical protein
MSPVSKVPSRCTCVAWLAVDLEEGRRALLAKGKITQLVTDSEVRGMVVQPRFQPQRAVLWLVVVVFGLPR